MSQRPRSRPVDAPAADDAVTTPAAIAATPSNAPTLFLLILVVGMMAFIAWWAFLGKGARANANAVLSPPSALRTERDVPPRLDAIPARLKPSPKPVPSATPAPDSAAPNEAAPVISEVPAPATEQQKPAKRGATARALRAATAAQGGD